MLSLQSYLSDIALWTLKFWSIIFLGVSWCIALICSSLFTYLLFYHFMIPQNHLAIPVHFDFSTTHLQQPEAMVHLHGPQYQWSYTTQMEEMKEVREEHRRSRYFAPGHQYNAYIDITLPDSETNHDCGMLSLEMQARSHGTLLATSLQSFMPHYTSPLVRWMWSWAFALPLVTGIIQEKQIVTLHMFDQLLEQEHVPISEFRLILKSPQAHRFQMYSAMLRLQVQLFGLRYLMYHWPLSTGFILTSAIFSCQLFWSAVFLLAICLLCCNADGSNLDSNGSIEEGQPPPPAMDDPAEIDPFIRAEATRSEFWRDAVGGGEEDGSPFDQDDTDAYLRPNVAMEGESYRRTNNSNHTRNRSARHLKRRDLERATPFDGASSTASIDGVHARRSASIGSSTSVSSYGSASIATATVADMNEDSPTDFGPSSTAAPVSPTRASPEQSPTITDDTNPNTDPTDNNDQHQHETTEHHTTTAPSIESGSTSPGPISPAMRKRITAVIAARAAAKPAQAQE